MDEQVIELEGTWDEIQHHMPDFNGKRLRVSVHVMDSPSYAEFNNMDDVLERIWREVPESSWSLLPTDLAQNHDHYLYGVPKRE